MNRIVCKFGGSSVADAERMRKIAEIVRSDARRRYIVLSAPGKRCANDDKITDLLYRSVADGKIHHSIFSRIFQRYARIRDELAPKFDLEAEFDAILAHDPADTDYFVSRGEALCAKLFAAYTGFPFVDAADLLIFDEFGQINRAASALACVERLLPLERAVIPGFYGRAMNGGVRVFSRGGSDVSGAWIAALTRSDLYENWTDVNGLYSADPAIVDAPIHHSTVGFDEAEAILRAGANVLHPDSLQPLRCAGIDCVIRNSFSPDSADTRISQSGREDIFCVTGRRNLYMRIPTSNGDPILYTKPISDMKPISDAMPISGAEPISELKPISDAEPISDMKPTSETNPISDAKPISDAEPISDAKSTLDAKPIPKLKPISKVQPISDTELISDAELISDVEPISEVKPILDAKPTSDVLCVAAVAVFGLNAAQIERLQREIEPIHTIHMQEHVEIIVSNEKYAETVRRIHNIFTE